MSEEDSWLMCAWTPLSVMDTPQGWMCCGLEHQWSLYWVNIDSLTYYSINQTSLYRRRENII